MLPLCRLDHLAPGSARGFEPDGPGTVPIVVVRSLDGEVHAYQNWCPHQGARLEYAKDRFLSKDGRHMICHAHGAHFDAASGVCLYGASLGQALIRVRCLVESGWVRACSRPDP